MKYKIFFVLLLTISIVLFGFPKKHQFFDFGPHASTADFQFQEKLRGLELTVTKLAAKQIGDKQAEHLFIQGWTSIISAAYLLNQTNDISKPFRDTLKKELSQVFSRKKVVIHGNLFTNVIDSTVKMKTFKESPGLEIKPVKIGNTIPYLNALVKKHELKFTLNKDSRIYLEIAPEFFAELWQSDFPAQLKRIGVEGFEMNNECPHVTLIGSPAITQIKEKCFAEKGDKGRELFDLFISTVLDNINSQLKRADKPIMFTQLVTKHAETYSPFDKVIMVDLHSPVVAEAMKYFVEEVEKRFKIKINTTKSDKYHVTIAIKPRKPEELGDDVTIQDVIKQSGIYSHHIQTLWKSIQTNTAPHIAVEPI